MMIVLHGNLTAKEIKHDKEKKIIYYKDAWLKLYDKPVFYFPKFFHPDPTVKRQSGFLMPTFERLLLVFGYIFSYSLLTRAIADNKDITLTTKILLMIKNFITI